MALHIDRKGQAGLAANHIFRYNFPLISPTAMQEPMRTHFQIKLKPSDGEFPELWAHSFLIPPQIGE